MVKFKPNEYLICGDVTKILITKQDGTNLEILIDTEDYDRIKDKRWYVNKRGYVQHDYMVDRKKYRVLLHRLIMNCPEDMMVDHAFGNKLDNRKCVLKICTKQENQLNLQNCKVGHRLVYKKSRGDGWRVQVKLGQRTICIATYYDDDYERACQDAKYLLAYVAPHSNIGRQIDPKTIPQWIKDKVDTKLTT